MGLTAATGPSPAGLTIAGLTYRAGRSTILHGLSLAVARGRVTAILGAPGSGKSTLMNVLAGFSRAAGEIRLDGQDVARLPARRRGFGVVQQRDVLFPHMTIAGNVDFPLRQRRVPRVIRARMTAEILDMMELAHAAALRPDQAAPAERQRAVLARAAVFAPRLLLLDEPFGDQDFSARAQLIAGFRRIHALLGCTTLLATRHGADALAVADHIAVLREGALVQHGPASEIFDRPRDPAVASLLGETNQFPGRVEALEDDIAILRLDCGPRVEAATGRTLRPGDPCLLVLGPDRIAIAPVAAADMGEGAIDAVLIETRCLGDTVRLRLLIGTGAELIVHRPASAGLRGLSVGQTAAIAWQPHHATAFPP